MSVNVFNKLKLPKPVKRFIGDTSLKCKEKSPQILFISGTILFGVTIYKTIQKSLRLPEIIEQHKAEMKAVEEIAEETGENSKKDILIDKSAVWIRTIARGGKLYAVPFICAAGSVGCFLGAMKIINGRYISMASLYAATRKENENLKDGIVERAGEEALEEIKNSKDNDEGLGVFEIEFSRETNDNYEDDLEANRVFLWSKQCFANRVFEDRGHLFYNEALELFGFKKTCFTQAGQIMGNKKYKSDEEARENGADNYIDIGIFMNDPAGSERAMLRPRSDGKIILRFNVDKKPIIGDIGLPVQ